ncbi:hypothetical protein GCM10010401_03090 [Rarobacter faecitabidus]|uniref:Uncharacterized protein n=1 Tax=Rarobacter faecitabidus TaxID=13243 RepID=A0A542ZUA2_RARFA|nr:hypothetical protein [Rarobacter faecitabidus]TQL63934.1 hypothetical protein FB461_0413 [Rarobacter faecitabidus]
MVPEPSPLAGVAGAFNNKAIGDRNAGNSAKFNATETSSASEFFIRDTLVGAGMLPGKRYPLPGDDALSYVLHDAGSGSPATAYDNITAQGQTTEFGDVFAGAGKIAFVVSANNGSAVDQNVVLNFADGSSSTVVVTATDWCDSTPQPGNLRAGRTSERWAGGAQGLGCGLFATQTIDLEGETLESITWPVKPNFHVFAIATDEAVTVSGTATISGSAQYSPDGSVLTGTPPTFTATGGAVTPIYQWTRNGAPIPGASALTYTIVPGQQEVDGDDWNLHDGRRLGGIPMASRRYRDRGGHHRGTRALQRRARQMDRPAGDGH